jgi:hypothetical protein
MLKKRKPTKDGLGPGTFVRLDTETRLWLEEKAAADGDRSVSSMIRKLLMDAKVAEAQPAERVPEAVSS